MDTKTAENIIDQLGLDGLSQEEQEQVLERVGKIIYQAVLERVLGELSDEDKNTLDEMLAGEPTGEEVLSFIRERVSNIDDIIKEEAQKFREESEKVMGALDESPNSEAPQEQPASDTQDQKTDTQQ